MGSKMDKPGFLKNISGIECPSIDEIVEKSSSDASVEKNALVKSILAYLTAVYIPALKKYNGGRLPLKKYYHD